MSWVYNEDRSRIILPDGKPHSVKKVTGTRFAAVLGLNTWATPFQMWCEITKLVEKPFTGNIYTQMGQAVEPKVIKWLKETMYEHTYSPEEYYGLRYPEVHRDFYKEKSKRYGGMWDAKMLTADQLSCTRIVEIKTTKRAEDWIDGPPTYYLCQVLLYAYLDGVKQVTLTCTFLEDDDYNHPDRFIVTDENTSLWSFNVETTTIEFNGVPYTIAELVSIVDEWYDAYIESGISPEFDEEVDKEYLDILRTMHPEYDMETDDIIQMLESLEYEYEQVIKNNELDAMEKRIKVLKESIKNNLIEEIETDDTKTILEYGKYKLKKTTRKTVDSDKLKDDGLYDQYLKVSESYTLTKSKK